MAFPTTPVLDDFNTGATQNLTARSGWGTVVLWSGETTLQTNATPDAAVVPAVGAWKSNYWNTSFTDCEVWTTVSDLGSGTNNDIVLSTRAANVNTGNVSEYASQVRFSTGAWSLFWYSSGIFQGFLASGTIGAFGVGDSYGMSSIGTLHTVYYKAAAGSWASVGSATDATFASGFLGLEALWDTTTGALTEFGGGAVVAGGAPARDTHVAIPFTQGAGGGAFGGAGPH